MTSRQWLIATLLTFLTICAWVLFNILYEQPKPDVPPNTEQLIKPIDPEFNTSGL